MKTLTTQHPPSRRLSWTLLPALLVALLSFCAFPSTGQTWTVGTGTSMYAQTGTPISPLGFYYPNVRVNYLYDTAALSAAGMPVGTPTSIHQLAFNVGALQSAMGARNFEIKIGQTTLTALPAIATGFLSGMGGYPVYYSSAKGFNPSLGWNTLNLSSPFLWNGTSNIVIEICYLDNATSSYGAGQAGVYYHTTTGGLKSVYAYGTGATPYCGNPVNPISSTTNRPNIRFSHLTPCTGKSVAFTTTPSGTITGNCPGSTATIVAQGYTNALNTEFQWWTSSSPTGPWTPAKGDSASDRYTTPPMIANTYYRVTVTCMMSLDTQFSPVVGFTFAAGFPVYASMPFFESFEAWGNGCATSDKISSNNWTNTPNTGASSWRRNDQGASASWGNVTSTVTAKPIDGSYFARWHGYTAPVGDGGSGVLQLYVNTAATAGNKDLSFYYYFEYASPSATVPIDSIIVDYSTDGGVTFNGFGGSIGKIGAAFGPQQTWNLVTIPNIPVSSPTTVFRFRAKHGYASGVVDDIYIDAVRIDPPCGAKPVAGKIDSVIACPGKIFKLKLKGNVPAAGLTYLWQYKPAGSSFWSPLPGGNVASPSYSMTSATQFRAIVTCTNTTPNVSDTTPVYNAPIAPFYYCYCSPTFNQTYIGYGYGEVGNLTILTQPAGVALLNNGTATPVQNSPSMTYKGYEDFRLTVAPPVLVRDSTYRISISQISGSNFISMDGVAWLDINRNGVFEPSEVIIKKTIASAANPTVFTNFTIPSNAPVGLTGLRVSTFYTSSGYYPIDPCAQPYYGQFEDYLVRIEYQPCIGPVNPGTASVSDTAICRGYTVDLYDTSYEKTRTNILRMWEVSTNGGASFSAIPGSAQKDTMKNVTITATSQYRLRVICGATNDTTYSNVVTVRAPEPYRCYPTSWAGPGGDSDSSDIGSFILGDFINPAPGVPTGPHLLNPMAHQRRTDFTLMPPISLSSDSVYRLAVFHTMPRGYHGNALVSVYMDYNNDGDYDLTVPPAPFTSELVYQGLTTSANFFLDTFVKMPSAVIPGVLTGMRVIVNNDTNPFGPGNTGAGNFTSGEVEDYVVIFNRTALKTGPSGLLQNLALYPNPTEGKFTVLSDATRSISHMDVVVSTITGQQVINRSFDNVGTHFTTSLDLSTQAKGIYFVEIRADGEKITKKLIVR